MTDFLATLSSKYPGNWEICKRESLWGVVGRGTNWRKNAQRVKAGDRIFVWKSRHGMLAQLEALGPLQLAGPGVRIPWPDPDWFGGVFPMRVVAELATPVPDSFPDGNGRNGVRFGFNNTALQHIFEEISPTVAARVAAVFPGHVGVSAVGVRYTTPPAPSGVAAADPFTQDPDLIDRGLLAHHEAVEALAKFVGIKGLVALVPTSSSGPQFDLAWFDGDTLYVAEVKSITSANEEKQLRLGLGQVLRYRHQLRGSAAKVEAWLVPERQPADASWAATCATSGVRLTWPPAFA